jgi:hypothetical protein
MRIFQDNISLDSNTLISPTFNPKFSLNDFESNQYMSFVEENRSLNKKEL